MGALLALALLAAARQGSGPPAEAFGLPLLDLSGEHERLVVVDRQSGQYLGHPTTVLLEDGRTMLCAYPMGHGQGAILLKRSTDGGLTWSERLPVPGSWASSKETPTIHRVVLPDGQRRLVLFSGLHPVRRSISQDDGATWSELEPVGEWGGIVAMASLAPLADGSHAVWFHDDGRFLHPQGGPAGRFTVYQSRSRDGGLTWSVPVAITSREEVDLCEPGFLRSPDGKTLALLLRENRRVRESFAIFSRDEAQTWSEPLELPRTLTGDRHVARLAPDGRAVVSFRDTARESPTQGDWLVWVGRWEDVAERKPGSYRVRLMDNRHAWDCAYSGLELLPDGTFVATTYGHWTQGEEPYVVSVRFKLEELDARIAGRAGER